MAASLLSISVVWATPQAQDAVALRVPDGTTLAEAVARSGLAADYGLDVAQLCVGVFGKRRAPDTLARDGDRIEIYRPLQADPKDARRRRAHGQGSRQEQGPKRRGRRGRSAA